MSATIEWQPLELVSDRSYSEIALDVAPDGVAHAVTVWSGDDRAGLVHVHNSGGTWHEEPLTAAPAGGADHEPTLTRDGDGNLWLAFTRWSRFSLCWFECSEEPNQLDGIYLMSYTHGGWSQPVRAVLPPLPASFGDVGASPRLVTKGDVVHLAYTGFGDTRPVVYGRLAGGEWASVMLSPDGTLHHLEVADDGTIHVIFEEYNVQRTRSIIQHAVASGGDEFQVTTFHDLPLPEPAYATLFELDQLGRVHAAFYGDDQGSQHSVLANGGWSMPDAIFEAQAIDDGDDRYLVRPFVGAIAVDVAGALHALSRDIGSGGQLVYASNREGSFASYPFVETSQWEDGLPLPADIALDSDGRPQVIFVASAPDGDGFALWYAAAR